MDTAAARTLGLAERCTSAARATGTQEQRQRAVAVAGRTVVLPRTAAGPAGRTGAVRA